MNNIILAAIPLLAALETRGIAAFAAAIAISCGAFASTYAMGKATSAALEAGARQPEIISKLQTMLSSLSYSWSQSVFMHSLLHSF